MNPHYPGTGGGGSIDWSDKLPPVPPAPKKKTLEFENLTCTYEQEAGILTVSSCGTKMTFDVKEQSELRAAMTAFGLGQPAGSTVNYR